MATRPGPSRGSAQACLRGLYSISEPLGGFPLESTPEIPENGTSWLGLSNIHSSGVAKKEGAEMKQAGDEAPSYLGDSSWSLCLEFFSQNVKHPQ